MKPPKERYKSIPTKRSFMDIPGIYCQSCGETFALYDFSIHQPDGYDKNNKPFYKKCFKCERVNDKFNVIKKLLKEDKGCF